MRIVAKHTHLNGHEWLLVHEKKIWREIETIIEQVDAKKYKTKVSKRRREPGDFSMRPRG